MVEFVAQKSAFDLGVVEDVAGGGFEADFVGEGSAACEDMSGRALALVFEKVADAGVVGFEFIGFAEPEAVFWVEDDMAGFVGDVGFGKVTTFKVDEVFDACGHGVFARGLDGAGVEVGCDDGFGGAAGVWGGGFFGFLAHGYVEVVDVECGVEGTGVVAKESWGASGGDEGGFDGEGA